MNKKPISKALISLFIASIVVALTTTSCVIPAPTREQIVAKYPTVDQGSMRPENRKILCPFTRMLERSSLFDSERLANGTSVVSVDTISKAAIDFGCSSLVCKDLVAKAVSSAQGRNGVDVDIEKLHAAGSVSHQCGLTFAQGGTEVSDAVRQTTLGRLALLADAKGHLTYANIYAVKQAICAEQGLAIDNEGGDLEPKVLFAYLGGVENGFVALSDVDKLLHAEMPATKAKSWVDALLLLQVK